MLDDLLILGWNTWPEYSLCHVIIANVLFLRSELVLIICWIVRWPRALGWKPQLSLADEQVTMIDYGFGEVTMTLPFFLNLGTYRSEWIALLYLHQFYYDGRIIDAESWLGFNN